MEQKGKTFVKIKKHINHEEHSRIASLKNP